MRILVAGGFGYVGGRLSQALAARGHAVVLGSRRSRTSPEWLPGAEVTRLEWDDSPSLREACAGVDVVAHVAGMNARDSADDPASALAFNGGATARLLRAAIAAGVPRFLYLSTSHVYATPLRGTIDESSCPTSLHPYAASHRAGEDAVRFASERGEIEGIVIRLSNAFGAPTDVDAECWTLLVNDLCRQAAAGGRMELTSSGLQRRDFVPMTEACAALAHLVGLHGDLLGNGLFNVGGGWSPTVLEVAERVASRVEVATGAKPAIRRQPVGEGERSETLQFVRQKLLDTGFAPAPPAAIDVEIDALIQFCVRHYSTQAL